MGLSHSLIVHPIMNALQKQDPRFSQALEAAGKLWVRGFEQLSNSSTNVALVALAEIQSARAAEKSGIFYRHFLPLRREAVALLAEAYRRCFKLAVANPRESKLDPHKWTLEQLQPAVNLTFEWIRDWYILACDGENQWVRRAGSVPFDPGQTVSISIPASASPSDLPGSWRVPAWLFQISVAFFGFGLIKSKHVPQTDSEEKLGASHTRLLLKGARRVFLSELNAAIETVWNEETAAAGAIRVEATDHIDAGRPNKQQRTKRSFKGVEGLGQKHTDLSRYMHNLTEKQQMAFSLKFEYELGLAQIALRMGLDRKTAYEHIEAAKRKVNQVRSAETRKSNRAKGTPG